MKRGDLFIHKNWTFDGRPVVKVFAVRSGCVYWGAPDAKRSSMWTSIERFERDTTPHKPQDELVLQREHAAHQADDDLNHNR